MLFFTFIATVFAVIIAFGVIYNSARIALTERGRELRIALTERGRELASLRVLGFTRAEISYILLGELGLLTLIAIPLGFVVGRGICTLFVNGARSELYRIPLIIHPSTYAFAATVVLASALLSGWAQTGSAGFDRRAQDSGLNHDRAPTSWIDFTDGGDHRRVGLRFLAATAVGGSSGYNPSAATRDGGGGRQNPRWRRKAKPDSSTATSCRRRWPAISIVSSGKSATVSGKVNRWR